MTSFRSGLMELAMDSAELALGGFASRFDVLGPG